MPDRLTDAELNAKIAEARCKKDAGSIVDGSCYIPGLGDIGGADGFADGTRRPGDSIGQEVDAGSTDGGTDAADAVDGEDGDGEDGDAEDAMDGEDGDTEDGDGDAGNVFIDINFVDNGGDEDDGDIIDIDPADIVEITDDVGDDGDGDAADGADGDDGDGGGIIDINVEPDVGPDVVVEPKDVGPDVVVEPDVVDPKDVGPDVVVDPDVGPDIVVEPDVVVDPKDVGPDVIVDPKDVGPDVVEPPKTCDGQPVGAFGTFYTGPEGTLGKGICAAGVTQCGVAGNWVVLKPDVKPQAEVCDKLDNNCDGKTDEDKISYSGPFGTEGVGVCKPNIISCVDGKYAITQFEKTPSDEKCNGADDDCNGKTDEGFYKESYDGPVGTANIGICKTLITNCVGGVLKDLQVQVLPGVEICDGKDNDCNGKLDEGFFSETYGGDPATGNVGICKSKVMDCIGGQMKVLQGEVLPGKESCNGADDDCNGKTDEGFFSETYGGDPATGNVGICKSKVMDCVGGSMKTLQAQVLPGKEVCNGADDDCNGLKDDGLTQTAYSGDPKTQHVGICVDEVQECVSGVTKTTQVQVLPAKAGEICGDGVDNDCDGKTDEGGCTCDGNLDGYVDLESFDQGLKAAVLEFLGKGPNDKLTNTEAADVTSLNLSKKGLISLKGIECFKNLTSATLDENNLTDFAPLAGISGLQKVFLRNNNGSDLSPFEKLYSLKYVSVPYNPNITDFLPLIKNPAFGQGAVLEAQKTQVPN
ncbi:MAG: MopE-related protein, partial [Bacteroidales bacterium]|nr:MopE-related protein [Bacteroidales bacterium]